MPILKISSKGSIGIPAKLRVKYKLKAGQRIAIVDYGDVLSLVPLADDPITASAGMLKGERSLTTALLEDRNLSASARKGVFASVRRVRKCTPNPKPLFPAAGVSGS